jgi:myo-inositol catabolism protein IolC
MLKSLGHGALFLLAQCKRQLGHKVADAVTVFLEYWHNIKKPIALPNQNHLKIRHNLGVEFGSATVDWKIGLMLDYCSEFCPFCP